MESNRLSSAKWSRNLNEDSQNEANRLRLLERQRQILETKLQRRQQQSTSTGVVSSRPATSVAGVRARAIRQPSSDSLFDGATSLLASLTDKQADPNDPADEEPARVQPEPVIPRARTSVGGSRTKPPDPVASNGTGRDNTVTTNLASSNAASRSTPTKTNLRGSRSLSKSEANLNSDPLNVSSVISPNPLTTILTDEEMLKFVSQPIPAEVTLQCTIIRDKKGIDRSLYPTYYMHLQDIIVNGTGDDQTGSATGNKVTSTDSTATVWMSGSVDSLESIKSTEEDSGKEDSTAPKKVISSESNGVNANTSTGSTSGRKVFVLSGRRRKKSKTYLIGNNAFDISRDKCMGKLKSNVLGTQFTAIRLHSNGVRYEIASITYETNVLGFKGPRKMTTIIPKTDEKMNVLCNLSLQEELKRNSRAITLLKNKTPIWNEETQSYVLNFHGRVTQASVKNFQLVVQEGSSTRGSKCSTVSEMRRSASSQQLRQRQENSDSNTQDFDEEDEDGEGEEETQEGYGQKRRKSVASTGKPPAKSRSGYLLASCSEDAKNLATDLNELVSLQFGRVSNTQFSCDVSSPLSLMQAFAIALSSFDSKLACE